MRMIERLRAEIAALTHDERIELARWIVRNLPECVAAVEEQRPTLVEPWSAPRPAELGEAPR